MSERSSFENQWQEEFEGAEMTPAPEVWSNIRAEVASAQANKKSKQVVYWRWLTAASVVLFMTAGAATFYYYDSMSNEFEQLVQKEEELKENIALLEDELDQSTNNQSAENSVVQSADEPASNTAHMAGVVDSNNDQKDESLTIPLERYTDYSDSNLNDQNQQVINNDQRDLANASNRSGQSANQGMVESTGNKIQGTAQNGIATTALNEKPESQEKLVSKSIGNRDAEDSGLIIQSQKEVIIAQKEVTSTSNANDRSINIDAEALTTNDMQVGKQDDQAMATATLNDEPEDNKSLRPNSSGERNVAVSDEDFSIERLELIQAGDLAVLPDPITPQKVPDYLEIIKMQNGGDDNLKGMWAGLSLGGGSYNSNIGQGSSASSIESLSISGVQESVTNVAQVNQSTVETPAFSFTLGADFGKQIGKRTFLQGGLEYNRYGSQANSNVSVADASNSSQSFFRVNNSASLDDATLTVTSPYTVSNNFQYVSIPMKMGYQVIDRKVGLSVSSGVATNLFIKNTVSDKSGDRADVEITNSNDSPFKPVNFNALLAMELSYRWNEQYQLSLVPDYRISMDGITKTDAFFQSNPTAFFLGFRFKYILR